MAFGGNEQAATMMRGQGQRKSAKPSQQESPKGCYVYAIYVDGVLRYVGKGTNGRMYAHMKQVRQRLTREFKLKNISPIFQQKLTEAVIKGAVVEEVVIADNLTSKQAYELEHRRMADMVHDGRRGQLWNVVPPSIYTIATYLRQKFPRGKFASTSEWAEAVVSEVETVLLPERAPPQDPTGARLVKLLLSAATFNDEFINQQLKLVERLESMFERAFKSLVQIKVMKQMLGRTKY